VTAQAIAFEAMLARREATKTKQDEILKKMESGEATIFDWFLAE
jgi:hypothetical protein